MKFCVNCENMYYITINETDPNKLSYYCRNCGHKDADAFTEGVCVLNTHINSGAQTVNTQNIINKFTKLDPTLPRVYNIPCPNEECKTNTENKSREVLYIRYHDDKLLYLYMCCVCDTVWK